MIGGDAQFCCGGCTFQTQRYFIPVDNRFSEFSVTNLEHCIFISFLINCFSTFQTIVIELSADQQHKLENSHFISRDYIFQFWMTGYIGVGSD